MENPYDEFIDQLAEFVVSHKEMDDLYRLLYEGNSDEIKRLYPWEYKKFEQLIAPGFTYLADPYFYLFSIIGVVDAAMQLQLKKDKKQLVFTCKCCGCNQLIERRDNTVSMAPIDNITLNGNGDVIISYDESNTSNDETIISYQCANCSLILRDVDNSVVRSTSQLVAYLKGE